MFYKFYQSCGVHLVLILKIVFDIYFYFLSMKKNKKKIVKIIDKHTLNFFQNQFLSLK